MQESLKRGWPSRTRCWPTLRPAAVRLRQVRRRRWVGADACHYQHPCVARSQSGALCTMHATACTPHISWCRLIQSPPHAAECLAGTVPRRPAALALPRLDHLLLLFLCSLPRRDADQLGGRDQGAAAAGGPRGAQPSCHRLGGGAGGGPPGPLPRHHPSSRPRSAVRR